MHRTTQLKTKNRELPTLAHALAYKRVLAELMWVLGWVWPPPVVFHFSVCFCNEMQTRVDNSSQQPSDPLAKYMALYKTAVLVCSKFLPLAVNSWQVTIKHEGHRHMELIQGATLGFKSWQREREKNPLENPGRKWTRGTVQRFAALWSKESKSDFHSNRPTSAHKNSFTKCNIGFQLHCARVKLRTQWPIGYGPDIYVIFLFIFFLLDKKKIVLGFCAALSFPISVTAIISWNLTPGILQLFNFLFSQTQVYPPSMSTTS